MVLRFLECPSDLRYCRMHFLHLLVEPHLPRLVPAWHVIPKLPVTARFQVLLAATGCRFSFILLDYMTCLLAFLLQRCFQRWIRHGIWALCSERHPGHAHCHLEPLLRPEDDTLSEISLVLYNSIIY